MIQSYGDPATHDLFVGRGTRRWVNIQRTAMRKLAMLNRASRLDDLRLPTSNHLKALKGELAGFHSIRINDQFRIVFIWRDGQPYHVSIVDYH
jgi:proteic killer suppression protein